MRSSVARCCHQQRPDLRVGARRLLVGGLLAVFGEQHFARRLGAQRSQTPCVAAGQHNAWAVGYPKMPGEPKRVQPSRAKASASDDAGKSSP